MCRYAHTHTKNSLHLPWPSFEFLILCKEKFIYPSISITASATDTSLWAVKLKTPATKHSMYLQWKIREFLVHKLLCIKLELHLFFSCLYQALGNSEPDGSCHCLVKYYSLLVIITQILSITALKQSCICKMCSRETSAILLLWKVSEDCLWVAAGSCSAGYVLIFYRPHREFYYWIKNKEFCCNIENRKEGTSLTDNCNSAISLMLAYWQCCDTELNPETSSYPYGALPDYGTECSYTVSSDPSNHKSDNILSSMYHNYRKTSHSHGSA